MRIAGILPEQHTDYLGLVNAEIRPDRAKSNAWDDFPVILSPDNLSWTLAATTESGVLAGGVACLIRQFITSCGRVPVAGIGSVVTRPEFRGQGISSALQNEMLTRLRRKNVPLAVLWTDQPEIYSGRGFAPAGWEVHLDFAGAELPESMPAGFRCAAFRDEWADGVASLYDRHSLRTIRHPGDAAKLYGMSGTSGLVALSDDGATIAAAVFCGKGADFPDYVTEWSGATGLVLPLLAEARRRELAHQILVPPGATVLADALKDRGAISDIRNSGLWAVLQPETLGRYLQAAGIGEARDMADPAQVLGSVDDSGRAVDGSMTVAVWGFDSV